ncbi:hypothetical protein [Mucilaginibacter arboris]|uniref:Gliding motility-associated protein GldM C-terminal domain-containing protein n=1 Tax=Mucilaginibacter arboris TaxID=2682090 RepID=A0A7K1SV60_9SPHI|nr:hypothetical protein [Mucilaginibacter arboris]MVN21216.1 hypothetical protein [Mucilaginibacter arboris]
MKQILLLTFLTAPCIAKLFAQNANSIRAFEAAEHIGKTVTVTATVINVKHIPQSKTISLGLSDWRNKDELLTLVIHQKHYSKSYYNYLRSLNGKLTMFTGKVLLFKGQLTINMEGSMTKIGISEIIPINIGVPIVPISVPLKDVHKYIGEYVSICDMAYDYKIVGDSVFLNVGANYPNQNITVSVSRKVLPRPEEINGKRICFDGIITLLDNRPTISINEKQRNNINVK